MWERREQVFPCLEAILSSSNSYNPAGTLKVHGLLECNKFTLKLKTCAFFIRETKFCLIPGSTGRFL